MAIRKNCSAVLHRMALHRMKQKKDQIHTARVCHIQTGYDFPLKHYFKECGTLHEKTKMYKIRIPALTHDKEINDKTLPGFVLCESFKETWT